MPFNGSGTFTIVNTFIPNTTILSSAVNANFSDIATGLSDCLTRDGQAGMTAALKVIAGTASAPSVTFTSDTHSGMYLISSGNLGLTANSALALELNQFQVAQFQQAAEAKVWCVVDTADTSTSSNINTIATAGTGSIAIGTSTNWATNGYLIAGNEIMSYTVASANGLTINTRGEMGTTAVSHATGATINFLYSALDQNTLLLPARVTASRPSFPAPGEFAFNSGSSGLEFYNGTTWVSTSQPQIMPQGYLSPTAGVPIITGDVTSTATIFYNPMHGVQLPVPIAGAFTLQTFSTASIALSASQAAAGIYDVYAFMTGGALQFGFGPSWSAGTSGSVTAGSCARGTGVGGAAITRLNGVYVNTTTMTLLNGASSFSIATASGIMLGSVYINPATAGTVNLHRSYGQSRQWGIWNAFNRSPIYVQCGDGTASWTYATATVRPSNNATANNITTLTGLAEEIVDLKFSERVTFLNQNNNSAFVTANIGIGINSTGTASGTVGTFGANGPNGGSLTEGTMPLAQFAITPSLGINIATQLEAGNGTVNTTVTYFGTVSNMILTAQWRG